MRTPDDAVAESVARLRKVRQLSVRALSARMSELGVPILPSGITKIEAKNRGVSVGELVALAIALEVSPATLMAPHTDDPTEGVLLTPSVTAPASTTWDWMCARRPLAPVDLGEPDSAAVHKVRLARYAEDFELNAWPASERQVESSPPVRAIRRLLNVVRDYLSGPTAPAGPGQDANAPGGHSRLVSGPPQHAMVKELRRVIDEVEDLAGVFESVTGTITRNGMEMLLRRQEEIDANNAQRLGMDVERYKERQKAAREEMERLNPGSTRVPPDLKYYPMGPMGANFADFRRLSEGGEDGR